MRVLEQSQAAWDEAAFGHGLHSATAVNLVFMNQHVV